MKWRPLITYDVGPTVLAFSLSQRLWEPEEGVGYGDEDESGAGIIVGYVARYDYAMRVVLRFTDNERTAVMTFIEWILKNKGEAVFFRFDVDDVDSEFSVFVEQPRVGDRVRPTRDNDSPWVWELPLLIRSSTGQRMHVPFSGALPLS